MPALLLLVTFVVLVLALTFGATGLGVWALSGGHGGLGAVNLFFLAGSVATAVSGAVVRAVRLRPRPSGAQLTREAQPGLWRVVDELTVIAGTRAPDDILIVPEVDAAVCQRLGRRYLVIGLPLLGGLSVGEFRSVLAHELGHHAGLPALTHRANQAFAVAVTGSKGNLVHRLLRSCVEFYALVASSANRGQELRADEASVAAAGRAAAQSALRRRRVLAAMWKSYVEGYLAIAQDAQRTPRVLLGFRTLLGAPPTRELLGTLDDKLLDEPPKSVFDSHPTIRERIAAMDRVACPDVPEDDRPAWALLDDPTTDVARLERRLVRDDLGPDADWPEIAARAGQAHVEHYAGLLADAGRRSGVAKGGTLDEVLVALGKGELGRLGEFLVNPATTQEEADPELTEVVTELLACTVVAELIRTGNAAFHLVWGAKWQVRLTDGTPLDASALVAPAVADPAAVPEVRAKVSALCDRTLTA